MVEVVRIALLSGGAAVALVLALGPRLACRRYAAALARGRDRAAGFWGFVAAAGGAGPRS